eukprot:TRINITY_DN8241_c0_g1_i1.p1 TRINITY_DN8241_c0_g1~~TRINITY_DN8241_c0_g1_i1.p1  ORF type:complete len:494 (+),score=105.26 TRINITY_DN8241_c0_g1_i1:37-1518(+)
MASRAQGNTLSCIAEVARAVCTSSGQRPPDAGEAASMQSDLKEKVAPMAHATEEVPEKGEALQKAENVVERQGSLDGQMSQQSQSEAASPSEGSTKRDSPAMSPSATLGPGDLEVLRAQAIAAISAEMKRAASQEPDQGELPRDPSGPMSPRSDFTSVGELDVPDDAGDGGIMSLHASSTAPINAQAGLTGTSLPSGQARLEPVKELKDKTRFEKRHGAGPPGKVGFVNQGPFWTCDRAAVAMSKKQRLQKVAEDTMNAVPVDGGESQVKENPVLLQCGALTASASSIPGASQGESSGSQITRFIGNCIDLLANSLNVSADSAPPEEELTTVLLETKEQRLHWREFLSEAVSKSCASNLYSAFDVEAEPPRYARPPSSVPMPGSPAAAQKSAEVPLVAPNGAGWNESVAEAASSSSSSAACGAAAGSPSQGAASGAGDVAVSTPSSPTASAGLTTPCERETKGYAENKALPAAPESNDSEGIRSSGAGPPPAG